MSTKHIAAVAIAIVLSACGGDDPPPDSNFTNYSACGNSPNYASSVEIGRWRRFPVTVAIDLSAAPEVNQGTNRSMYLRAVQGGAATWGLAGGGIGAVTFVNSDADITISFANLGSGLNGAALGNREGCGAGVCPGRYFTKGGIIRLNAATLSPSNYFGDLATLETRVREVTAHEMGHALFALGHSPFAGDLMANGGGDLSQRDLNTIREAYCRPLQ